MELHEYSVLGASGMIPTGGLSRLLTRQMLDDIDRTKARDAAGSWRTTAFGRTVRATISIALLGGIVGGIWFLTREVHVAEGGLRRLVVGECYNFGNNGRLFDGPVVRPGEPVQQLKLSQGVCNALHTVEVAGQLPEGAYLQGSTRNASDCLRNVREDAGRELRAPVASAVVAFRLEGASSHTVYCLLQFTPPHQGRVLPSDPTA